MKDFFYKTLFSGIIAVLLLFLVQTFACVFSFEPLNGVTTESEKPKLTIQNYADGSFQNAVENYCREHFGFREWLIRCYNQLLWSCFKETNNVLIVRGKDNWLFEEVYVRDYYESAMYQYADDTAKMREILETEALRLWKVQELLKEYNIHIFVSINPGKDMIYPEYLPENRSYFRPVGIRAYDFYKKRFDELGINYIDHITVFKHIKDSVDYPLFPKTGTHWSNIASVYVFDSIIRYMEVLGDQNLHDLDIGPTYPAETRQPDNDLELVLNLLFPIKSPPNLYADVKVKEDSTAVKPCLLTIGDSFYWNFTKNIPLQDIFEKYPYWYYNYIVYGDEEHSSTLDLDLEKELMQTDYIMLNYGALQLYLLGSRFLSRALLHLCYDKATIDSAINRLSEKLKSDPKLYAEIVASAKSSQKSIEQALYENAHYMIQENPEKYFDELKGDKMPVSRNKNLARIRKNTIFARSKKQNDEKNIRNR